MDKVQKTIGSQYLDSVAVFHSVPVCSGVKEKQLFDFKKVYIR